MNDRTIKLTQRSVADLPVTGKDYKKFDTSLPGFHVRVTKAGARSYALSYRNADGEQRTIAIGKTSVLKADQAREWAQELLVSVNRGKDPSASRKVRQAEPVMNDLFADYLSKHAVARKQAASVKGDQSLWRLHLKPAFGTMKVSKVDKRDIDGFIAKLSDRKGAANRSLALLSKMLNLAVDWNMRADNPCKKVERYPENRKERFLTAGEAQRLQHALNGDWDRGGAVAVTLLLLTGARRSEVLKATWDQLSLTGDIPLWEVPREHIKGHVRVKSDLRRPLSNRARDLLTAWWAECGRPTTGWVFPSNLSKEMRRYDLKDTWSRVRTTVGLENVRLHDLRHSYASFAVNAHVSLYLVGKALGHRDLRTTERYAHVQDETLQSVSSAVSKAIA
jgi:integrase